VRNRVGSARRTLWGSVFGRIGIQRLRPCGRDVCSRPFELATSPYGAPQDDAVGPGVGRRLGIILGVLLVSGPLFGFGLSASGLKQDAAIVGTWSPTIDVGVIGIHAALLHTGKVLLYEYDENNGLGSKATLFDPKTNLATRVNIPFPRNVVCSGLSILPDGRILTTGGEPYSAVGVDAYRGISASTIFDPMTRAWSDAGHMAFARWYPSNVELPDGRTLVIGGRNATGTDNVEQLEIFDPASAGWTTRPPVADKQTGLYPRTTVLSNGKVLVTRQSGVAMTFDPRTDAWKRVDVLMEGKRANGSVVVLPGLHQIMSAGGINRAGVATDTAEVIDMSSSTPQWTYTDSMSYARVNTNLVLLGDGTVLAVGGGTTMGPSGAVKNAELYDPASGSWTTMAAQSATRTYHSTALLLPDGRVLSAGATSGLPEQTTVDIYSPPYLFRGSRPAISSAPTTIGYGRSLNIGTMNASEISRVALIRSGAVTHSVNFDQRYVDLHFTIGAESVTAMSPVSANQAPPGYYMLVIVNSRGVPSIARFVRLG
jgi:Domain of unknown function (DUF1929)/Glyoxal oxidase N-terminus